MFTRSTSVFSCILIAFKGGFVVFIGNDLKFICSTLASIDSVLIITCSTLVFIDCALVFNVSALVFIGSALV